MFLSVVVDQTCNTIYEIDTKSINTIMKNIDSKSSNDTEDLIPFNFEFGTFSNLIKSCAESESKDMSIWKALDEEQFGDLIKTTCEIVEKYVGSDDIPLKCVDSNGKSIDSKSKLIVSFIDAINITGKILDEYNNINISEM